MASDRQGDAAAHDAKVDAFLRAHPEILVGRDALHQARARISYKDDNTFGVYNKPFSNVVLIQEFDADTRERLFVVALINDAKAEEYYAKNSDDGEGDPPEDREPSSFLVERAPAQS